MEIIMNYFDKFLSAAMLVPAQEIAKIEEKGALPLRFL
jgi:hypothetical protein